MKIWGIKRELSEGSLLERLFFLKSQPEQKKSIDQAVTSKEKVPEQEKSRIWAGCFVEDQLKQKKSRMQAVKGWEKALFDRK